MNHPAWILRLFAAIDRRDAEAFAAFFADDGVFVMGNGEPIRGRTAVRAGVDGFFRSLRSLEHRLSRTSQAPGVAITEGRVTYTRHDGSMLAVPFATAMRLRDEPSPAGTGDAAHGTIAEYRVYVDASELHVAGDGDDLDRRVATGDRPVTASPPAPATRPGRHTR